MKPNNDLIKVLLVDDDKDDFFIMQRLFERMPTSSFSLEWAFDGETGAQKISQNEHDIYLIDYRLGAMTGLELLSQFDIADRRQPFIILTGAGDKKVEIDAMRMGVADYLVKGKFDTDLLWRVLHYSYQRKQMEQQRVEQLIEINASKDEFISLASHQLRTPATAVKQYIGMILQGFAGTVSDQQMDFLRHAYTSNDRQLKIIDDILRVARLDLDRISLASETFDLRDLVQSAIDDTKPDIDEKNQTIVYDPPKKVMKIDADDSYLGMAVSNIIDNASKYTEPGKNIRISMNRFGKEYHLKISDEGVGIDKKDFGKLFVKFSRISNPLSIAANGTGLGLYWANEIVELHGGRIDVDSEIDKGTTFTIVLPVTNQNK